MTGCFTVWISKKLNHSTYQFLLQIHIQYDEDVCRFTDFILLNPRSSTLGEKDYNSHQPLPVIWQACDCPRDLDTAQSLLRFPFLCRGSGPQTEINTLFPLLSQTDTFFKITPVASCGPPARAAPPPTRFLQLLHAGPGVEPHGHRASGSPARPLRSPGPGHGGSMWAELRCESMPPGRSVSC